MAIRTHRINQEIKSEPYTLQSYSDGRKSTHYKVSRQIVLSIEDEAAALVPQEVLDRATAAFLKEIDGGN